MGLELSGRKDKRDCKDDFCFHPCIIIYHHCIITLALSGDKIIKMMLILVSKVRKWAWMLRNIVYIYSSITLCRSVPWYNIQFKFSVQKQIPYMMMLILILMSRWAFEHRPPWRRELVSQQINIETAMLSILFISGDGIHFLLLVVV